MTDAERVALAQQAKTLLDNAAFQAALDVHRQTLLDRFGASEPGDAATWGEIHAELRALQGLKASLGGLLAGGDAIFRRTKLRTIA